MAEVDESESALTSLIQRLEKTPGQTSSTLINPPEISILASLVLPTTSSHVRSLAYLALSKLISIIRHPDGAIGTNSDEKSSEIISQIFTSPIESRLSTTDEKELIEGMSLLSALFQVDSPSASLIFLRDGILESILESSELLEKSVAIQRAVADVLSQASGSKSCRPIISTRASLWLDSQVQKISGDTSLRASSAIALTKLSRGGGEDSEASIVSGTEGAGEKDKAEKQKGEENLAQIMKGLVLNSAGGGGDDPKATLDAIEGLAYMSVETQTKESLSEDSAFLSRLFSLVPSSSSRKGSAPPSDALKTTIALQYGVAVIIANLSAYRPQLSEEEQQVEKLRRMTKTGATTGKLNEVPEVVIKGEDDASVKRRGKRLIQAGVLGALIAMAKSDSQGVRQAVGKALLSLVEDRENRGKVLQAGGAKALLSIIRAALDTLQQSTSKKSDNPSQPNVLEPIDLLPIQALAKLSITSSPVHVFGPNESAAYDAIRPFSLLLPHPSSTLLQKFEVLMALTNLASMSPTMATRVSKVDGLLGKVEVLLLDDNTMVQRASMELLCNLISCDEVFGRYSGEGETTTSKAAASRLHIVLALADVEDLSTRVAASGALAMLTSSPLAVESLFGLENGPKRVFSVLTELIAPSQEDKDVELPPPDDRLVHRGVVCLRNVLVNSDSTSSMHLSKEAENAGVVDILVGTLKERIQNKDGGSEIVMPAAEALKWLLSRGAKMPD